MARASGVLLLNSNAMEITLRQKRLTYRSVILMVPAVPLLIHCWTCCLCYCPTTMSADAYMNFKWHMAWRVMLIAEMKLVKLFYMLYAGC